MTSTPVTSDVASILTNLTTQPAKNEKAGENFSDVLSKQTQPEDAKGPERPEGNKALKVDNRRADQVKEPVKAKDVNASKPDGEEEAQVMEAAEALAEQMLQNVASELGISVEELEEVMAELGMTLMDLLQSDNLMQVFVVAGGANDAVSLLTNEDLYASFTNLNEQLTVGLEAIAELTGKDVGQIQDLLSQISRMDTEGFEGPVVENMDDSFMQTRGDSNQPNVSAADPSAKQAQEMMERPQQTAESHTRSGNQQEETEGQGNLEKSNPFMVTNQMQQQVEVISNGVSYTETVYSTETQMIMDQIMDFMKIQVGEDITTLQMQLQPESLGTVQVQIASKDGIITAQFTAQNEMVKNALESQMIQLRETFDAQGIKVEAIEVAVQSQAFNRNLHHGNGGRGASQQESKTSGRVRRLNLNALEEGMEDLLDEADQLAAQMMEQNGNTVDYTV